jgi:hypothetical protein
MKMCVVRLQKLGLQLAHTARHDLRNGAWTECVAFVNLKVSADIFWVLAVDDKPGVRSIKAKVYAGKRPGI